jgi:hypothetical protein
VRETHHWTHTNSTTQRAQAAKLISRFVQMVGPHFFPHVQKTEYRLERPLCTPQGRDYLLTGVVDVLSGAVSHALKLPFSTMPDDVEIWDYKSGRKPEQGSHELLDYEYQMRVYCELYRQQPGDYPARAMLVFVGELGDDGAWERAKLHADEFPKLFFPVHPTPKHIEGAMNDFHATVEAIEAERAKRYAAQWDAPPQQPIWTSPPARHANCATTATTSSRMIEGARCVNSPNRCDACQSAASDVRMLCSIL